MGKITGEDVKVLYEMLSRMRPHGSKAEAKFVEDFLGPLPGIKEDGFGNAYLHIGKVPVIWSSHTDTVHRTGGVQNIVRSEKYIISLHPKSASNCLGADDTAGVWAMMQMIKAKRPGLYIFHRGEEVGCKGSRHIVSSYQEVVKEYKFIIALDRRDNDSIITFQRGQRCCSDEFATSLALQLTPGYKLDPGGVWTDSAEYVDLVGECTNISVGYKNQHFRTEDLDLVHLLNLTESLITLDATKLVSKRKPGDKESRYKTYVYNGNDDYYGNYYNKGRHVHTPYDDAYYVDTFRHGYWDNSGNNGSGKWTTLTHPEWIKWRTKKLLKISKDKPVITTVVKEDAKPTSVPVVPGNKDFQDIYKLVSTRPGAVADLFFDWGFDVDTLKAILDEFTTDKKGDTTEAAQVH